MSINIWFDCVFPFSSRKNSCFWWNQNSLISLTLYIYKILILTLLVFLSIIPKHRRWKNFAKLMQIYRKITEICNEQWVLLNCSEISSRHCDELRFPHDFIWRETHTLLAYYYISRESETKAGVTSSGWTSRQARALLIVTNVIAKITCAPRLPPMFVSSCPLERNQRALSNLCLLSRRYLLPLSYQ